MHRIVVAALSLLLTAPAYAGGLGVLATGGAHTERVYFYSNADPDGNPYSDIDDYDQYQITQRLANVGGGLNLVLGDRDDRIIGDCRFYWLMDSPQTDPADADTSVPASNIVASYRDKARHLGMGMVGLSWGIVGDPAKFQLGAVGHVGAAFLTVDHTEFLAFDIGPAVTYRVARQVQVFGDFVYQGRHRKGFTHSGNLTVGARYMFD
jgi:hypothetical protein